MTIQQSILYSINTTPTRVSLARRPPLWGASLFLPDHEECPVRHFGGSAGHRVQCPYSPNESIVGPTSPLVGGVSFSRRPRECPVRHFGGSAGHRVQYPYPPNDSIVGPTSPLWGRFFLPLSALPLHEFRAEENDIDPILFQRLTIVPPVGVRCIQHMRTDPACQRDSNELAVGQVE